MNLREAYIPRDSAAGSLHPSKSSDVRFANSIVGNLGAPLGFEEEHRKVTSWQADEDIHVAHISENPLMEYFPSDSDGISSVPPSEEGVISCKQTAQTLYPSHYARAQESFTN